MKKTLDFICKLLKNLIGMLLILIILCVTIQIVARNILHIATPWTEEVARYLLIWMTFLGSPLALRNGEHLMVDLFYSKYPAKGRQWVHLFCDISISAFCAYLVFFGVQLCNDPKVMKFLSPSAGIPRYLVYMALPIGALLMLIVSIFDIYNTVRIIQGKLPDTTAMGLVNEDKTLEELDKERRTAGK